MRFTSTFFLRATAFFPMLFWAVLSVAPAVQAAQLSAEEYYTVEEYQKKHPAQLRTMMRFQTLVRGGATPVTRNLPHIRIAFIHPGVQASDYWQRSAASFKARMDELGLRYELLEFRSRPTLDVRLQEQQLREALQADPDYLVFTLDVGRHKKMIEQVLERGRPKIILQNITTPLRSWEGRQPLLYAGFDHISGTRLLADHFMLNRPQGGTYAMLYFSQGYVSTMRGDTFKAFVHPHWNLAGTYYTDGIRAKARQATLDILSSQDVDLIYACATDTALGAAEAMEQTGMQGKVLLNGWGGGSAELQALLTGKLDVTVMRMNDDNGVAMAEAIRLDLEGRPHEIPVIFSGEFVLVRKDIGHDTLEYLKKRAFRYSGWDDSGTGHLTESNTAAVPSQ